MVQLPVDVASDKHAGDYHDELIDNGILDGFKSKLEAIKDDTVHVHAGFYLHQRPCEAHVVGVVFIVLGEAFCGVLAVQ